MVKLLEVELGDVKAESDDVASAKVSSDLAGVRCSGQIFPWESVLSAALGSGLAALFVCLS